MEQININTDRRTGERASKRASKKPFAIIIICGQQQKQTSSCMCGRTEFKRERRNWLEKREEKKWVKDGNEGKKQRTQRKEKRSSATFGKVKNLNGPLAAAAVVIIIDAFLRQLNSLVSESALPELRRVRLGDAELVAGEHSVGEDGFKFTEHMREDEAELREVPPIVRVLVEHLHLALFEELDGLLALPHQIVDEDVEVLVGVQDIHLILVLRVDQVQALISVGQDVEDEGRAVFQIHLALLTQLHHLVHQLPCFLQRFLIRH